MSSYQFFMQFYVWTIQLALPLFPNIPTMHNVLIHAVMENKPEKKLRFESNFEALSISTFLYVLSKKQTFEYNMSTLGELKYKYRTTLLKSVIKFYTKVYSMWKLICVTLKSVEEFFETSANFLKYFIMSERHKY